MLGPAPVASAKRRAYLVYLGGGTMAPIEEWEWCCSGCGFRPRDKTRSALERLMRGHVCEAA